MPSGTRLDLTLVVTRLSHFFLRTLREDPADAEVALAPVARARRIHPPSGAGHLRVAAAGPRVKAKVEAIIRDEMTERRRVRGAFPGAAARGSRTR